jgi:hypothetical protein
VSTSEEKRDIGTAILVELRCANTIATKRLEVETARLRIEAEQLRMAKDAHRAASVQQERSLELVGKLLGPVISRLRGGPNGSEVSVESLLGRSTAE